MLLEELTERQSKVLKFIERTISSSGYPPTLREIGNAFGIRSTNGVNDHLRALMRKGYLAKEEGKSRTLKLLQPRSKRQMQHKDAHSIPIFNALKEAENTAQAKHLFAILDSETQQMTIFKKDINGAHAILAKFLLAL